MKKRVVHGTESGGQLSAEEIKEVKKKFEEEKKKGEAELEEKKYAEVEKDKE